MSHPRERDRPIREVELRITVEAENEVLRLISKGEKDSSLSDGTLSITIRGRYPRLVARRARRVADRIRDAAAAATTTTKDGERV